MNNNKRKLFIIGNGFDKAHKLPTNYSDFKKYLENNYACKRDLYRFAPEVATGYHGESVVINKDLLANLLYNLIDDVNQSKMDLDSSDLVENEDLVLDWNGFEEYLGQLNLEQLYEDNLFVQYDKEGDIDYSKMDLNIEIFSSDLTTIIPMISDLFKEWIETVDVHTAAPKKDFIELIDKENDIFLCFNYTETLEFVYECKNVFHIHGVVGDYELVIGHDFERSFDGDIEDFFDDYKNEAASMIHETLRKPVEKIIKDNETFFYGLDDISEIYSYGFGFGSVDLPYIKEILRKTNKPDTIFWLNNHDSEEADKQEKILFEKLGFKGTIKRFECQK